MAASPASADPRESDGHSADRGYNAIPDKVPGNVPSVGFEATATRDFGDEVGLGGRARTLDSMSVVMSSWGCSESGTWHTGDCVTSRGATFDVPLTFTIYADNAGVPGAVLATRTRTVAVQYRPSASPKCTDANNVPNGKWYSTKDHTCYNGFAQTIEMNLPDVTLPDQVIWTVKYNTTHYGEVPVGETAECFTASGGCGYDALNVGAESFPNARSREPTSMRIRSSGMASLRLDRPTTHGPATGRWARSRRGLMVTITSTAMVGSANHTEV